jgi:hypothetical protein
MAFGPAAFAACFALLAPGGGNAYNTYVDEYLRWPWRAGSSHEITTLPGDHPPPIEQAIDFDLSYQPVHSISGSGERHSYVEDPDSGCGTRVTIKDLRDNTYITYCHLSNGDPGWNGQPVTTDRSWR